MLEMNDHWEITHLGFHPVLEMNDHWEITHLGFHPVLEMNDHWEVTHLGFTLCVCRKGLVGINISGIPSSVCVCVCVCIQ